MVSWAPLSPLHDVSFEQIIRRSRRPIFTNIPEQQMPLHFQDFPSQKAIFHLFLPFQYRQLFLLLLTRSWWCCNECTNKREDVVRVHYSPIISSTPVLDKQMSRWVYLVMELFYAHPLLAAVHSISQKMRQVDRNSISNSRFFLEKVAEKWI